MEQQFGMISLASYMLVLISQTNTFASLYDVPMISNLLSSVKAKAETSGLIAVNLCSSGRKKVCFMLESSEPVVFYCKDTIKDPAGYMILS